jgi:ABC-type transport system substrate-binding protein
MRLAARPFGASLLALVALGAACSDAFPPPFAAAHPDDPLPHRGGTLHIGTFADLRTLDPAVAGDDLSSSIIEQMYAGLVDYDAEGKVVPDLAERFETSPDGLVYRFVLRQGVKFHDGSLVTAADVKRSIERALHPTTPGSNTSLFDTISGFAAYQAGKEPHLSGVVVEGTYVVAIHLDATDARFLPVLALAALRVVCPSAGDRYKDAWEPCGAGPYKLPPGGWERGRGLTLVRHEGYFRAGLPHVDAISWTFAMNRAGELYAFEDGSIDMTHDLGDAELTALRADPRWRPFMAPEPDRTVDGEVMNNEIAPFDRVEVRRAVAAAIDRSHYHAYKPESLQPTGQALPPAVPGYDPHFEGQRYDYDAALAHMAKAGLAYDPVSGRGGWPKPVPYYMVRQGSTEYTAQLLAQDLAKIGIRLELHLVNWPTFLTLAYTRGAVAMSSPGWSMDYPDPSDFFEALFSSKSIAPEQSSNMAFYENHHLDDVIDRARHELDPARRGALFTEANRIVCDEAPWAFTDTRRFVDVFQPYVRGYAAHPVWTFQTHATWLDRGAEARRDTLGTLWSLPPAMATHVAVPRAPRPGGAF